MIWVLIVRTKNNAIYPNHIEWPYLLSWTLDHGEIIQTGNLSMVGQQKDYLAVKGVFIFGIWIGEYSSADIGFVLLTVYIFLILEKLAVGVTISSVCFRAWPSQCHCSGSVYASHHIKMRPKNNPESIIPTYARSNLLASSTLHLHTGTQQHPFLRLSLSEGCMWCHSFTWELRNPGIIIDPTLGVESMALFCLMLSNVSQSWASINSSTVHPRVFSCPVTMYE